MSGKTENYHRNATEQQGESDTDFNYFITSDLPIEQVYNVLKLKNMSDKEIESTVEKIKEIRENIRKVVRKFLGKINSSYGHLDIPDLIAKGMKHAEKYGLTDAQKKVFIDHVLKGDIYNEYTYQNEFRYSPMAKFLGFDFVHGQMIKIAPKDHAKLNELHMLYDETKNIHADIKTNIANYRDCAPEAITGQYDRTKHNVGVSIHPVFAALFLPKVDYLERRMLYTNIARMVLSRAQAYLKGFNFHLQSNIAPGELDAEFELAHDIAYDPNALEYFKDDSPMDNIIKRYRAQVELYMTVLNLRQGRYYSTGYAENDGISGLLRVLNSYDWTFFDSPELFNVQDEGTVLRKLLAIFSCRPTFTQLSSFSNRYGLGHTSITNLSKTVFVNIPIVNIKLPIDLIGNQQHAISLARALTQTDYFIEHKVVVPKNKSVIYSNQVAFFYANRRYPTVNFNNANMTMRYMSLPISFINQTTINKTIVHFDNRFRIGRDWFDLRSVVMLQRPPINGVEIATGCSAAIVVDPNSPTNLYQGTGAPIYIHYNPSIASIQYLDGNQPQNQSQFVANTPVSFIDEMSADPSRIGFRTEARERGTIFFYVKC
ncbi:core protein [Yasminevirus sp. GU-2018]|uniref:Core protein n=1 Tax=Yasminevirus sp. GU-2018 TaxID=2420051 RepID=A0A5K0U9K4_9VIRU|nr:core protein [Yasminevirus sp. GU-2018]